jgi:hypothetical protein
MSERRDAISSTTSKVTLHIRTWRIKKPKNTLSNIVAFGYFVSFGVNQGLKAFEQLRKNFLSSARTWENV